MRPSADRLALLRFLRPAALDARARCSRGRLGGLTQYEAHFIVELDESVETITQEIWRPPFDLDFSGPEVEHATAGNLATHWARAARPAVIAVGVTGREQRPADPERPVSLDAPMERFSPDIEPPPGVFDSSCSGWWPFPGSCWHSARHLPGTLVTTLFGGQLRRILLHGGHDRRPARRLAGALAGAVRRGGPMGPLSPPPSPARAG